MPEFPVYDTLEIEGQTLVPYRADYCCNWLQVLDAILDPIHTSFLHSRMSRAQFSEGMGEIGELLFYQREMSFLGANVRRVDDHVWVRVNGLVLPTYTQAGAALSADRTHQIYTETARGSIGRSIRFEPVFTAQPAEMTCVRLGEGCISCAMKLAAHRAMAISGPWREFIDFEADGSAKATAAIGCWHNSSSR